MPLDPRHLTPTASLNRLRIVDLPGIALDAEARGKTGFDLLSTPALAQMIREQADALRLAPADIAREDRDMPPLLDACLASQDATIRAAAAYIGRRFGRNLGWLLLALKRGDAVNREARPDWDDSYWSYWAKVTAVQLGGGLLKGGLAGFLGEVSGIFSRAGYRLQDSIVPVRPDGRLRDDLALVGAARYAPASYEAALVFDFGGSYIKRGVARYTAGALRDIRRLPAVPTQHNQPGAEQARLQFMAATIAETWAQASQKSAPPAPLIPVAVAAYIQPDGQPYERQGGQYAELRAVTDNLQRDLSQHVSAHLGQPAQVLLLHDGTAAASVNMLPATIMLGTAIGVGYQPLHDNLRPMQMTEVSG